MHHYNATWEIDLPQTTVTKRGKPVFPTSRTAPVITGPCVLLSLSLCLLPITIDFLCGGVANLEMHKKRPDA